MPVIVISTNIEIAQPHALTKIVSHEIAMALGKDERYVMVHLHSKQEMCFAASTDPLAFVELKSLGLKPTTTDELSHTLCELLEDEMGIDPARIYIEFSAPASNMFGWNNSTF
ncbi:MAG: hypothetical protein HQM07_03135 [Zetaproteobacteria bacterium]|nr:hypothetical protein [Zetaproteobacteria bacterium]